MVRHTLEILQHLLQGFQSVSDNFGTLCIKGLRPGGGVNIQAQKDMTGLLK